jgi:hypothetical protein
MPKEVFMFGNSIAQNARIIYEDFPWLWAVRNQWYPGHMDVTVKNGYENSSLDAFLNSYDVKDVEVWVCYVPYGGEEERATCTTVIKIENSPEWKVNWAAKISGRLFSGFDICGIVLIRPNDKYPEIIRVYRIKKEQRYNFRLALNKMATAAQ